MLTVFGVILCGSCEQGPPGGHVNSREPKAPSTNKAVSSGELQAKVNVGHIHAIPSSSLCGALWCALVRFGAL